MGKTYQSTVIDAPVDEVWRAIRDFHDMSWAPNVVQSVEKVGDRSGDELGAVRILNGAFVETLKVLNNEDRTFSYSIDDGPSPISKDDVRDYVGRVRLRARGEGRLTTSSRGATHCSAVLPRTPVSSANLGRLCLEEPESALIWH